MGDDSDRARLLQGVGRSMRRPWRLHEAGRLSLDGLAERYGAARGLDYRTTGETPPLTWFLEAVTPAESHAFLHGALGGGPEGVLFYAERGIPVKRGRVVGVGWTVALYRLAIEAPFAYGIACLFRSGAAWGGRRPMPVAAPRGLIELPLAYATFAQRFLVAVTEDDRAAAERVFDSEFTAWMAGLPWRPTGEGVIRFDLRNGALCVYAKPKARSAQALDEFCERAAHIAARIVTTAGAG